MMSNYKLQRTLIQRGRTNYRSHFGARSGPASNKDGVRGKYYRRLMKEGSNIVVLEPDVAEASLILHPSTRRFASC